MAKKGVLTGRQISRVPLFGNTGIGISIFSYADEVTVGVLADEALVPDPQTLADAFNEELATLGAH